MINEINYQNILDIYENEISKNIKNKNKLFNFEVHKNQNIMDIKNMLLNSDVGHQSYNIFLIYEPKCRLVMSLNVKDKIINHFLTRYILEKKLTKDLDLRNCATRKNMGTSYALKLVKKYLNINKNKYHNFYVLKIDLKKYFYNIDHNILKSLLKEKLDSYEYDLIEKVIDSTNKEYINKIIKYYIDKYQVDIPYYEVGKGLPIGNMTSQFLSIYYLNKIDHFIVNNLKLKYYVRYMDDFIIIDKDLEKLKKSRDIIKNKLLREYKLEINDKKTMIINVKNSFSFLGYTFKVINNKIIIKIKKSNIEKIKKKVKSIKYKLNHNLITHKEAFASIMSYSNIYNFSNNIKIINIIKRYFYNE